MTQRARSPGQARDESDELHLDIEVELEVDADVDVLLEGGNDAKASAAVTSAFDEAPTAVRTGVLGRQTNRAEQLRRLALVGMRVGEVAKRLDESTNALLGYAHVLSTTPARQPASPRAIAAVQREAEHCAALSRSVIELAKAPEARPEPVAADALLREAIRVAREPGAPEGRIAVAVIPQLPPLFVRGDDVALALGRIIRNALDATEGEGEGAVALSAEATTRRGRPGVTLSVTDSGPGIPSGDLAHVFEPFFTTRAKSGHAGLGLAVARAIVDAEGGQIEIQSGAGTGTTVRIWLPLPEERPDRPRARSGTRVKRQG